MCECVVSGHVVGVCVCECAVSGRLVGVCLLGNFTQYEDS